MEDGLWQCSTNDIWCGLAGSNVAMAKDCIGADVDGLVNGLKDGEVLLSCAPMDLKMLLLVSMEKGFDHGTSWSLVAWRP